MNITLIVEGNSPVNHDFTAGWESHWKRKIESLCCSQFLYAIDKIVNIGTTGKTFLLLA